MSTMAASARMTELAAIVGEQHVVESAAALKTLALDGVIPAIAVSPANADEVAAVLRYAYERDLTVVPAGGMVHQEIGNTPPQVDVLLRTGRMVEIEHYDPGDLTIGVGAGFTIHDLQALLRLASAAGGVIARALSTRVPAWGHPRTNPAVLI